jgi:phosphoenolpyruvate carboxylase
LSVLLLAKWGHLGPKDGNAPLDVAPLFETTEELEGASSVMESLLSDELYQAHLRERGNRQFVMLAYAAGNRHGDISSARWALDKAHRALAEVMQRHGVELVVFHGRGGPLSRTGGAVHEALGALPRAAVANHLRMTEKGDAINTRYGLRGIALRSLEQLVSAVLWNEAGPAAPADPPEWHEAMGAIAAASGAMFADLVFNKEFSAYFRDATPIDVIERIDAEGVVRSPTMSPVEGVDEGAWILSWAQNRCLLHGWFGFGTAINAAIQAHGIEHMRDMVTRWPLFRILVADVEFALAKSDLDVTEQYSQLAGAAHEQFFPRLRREYDGSIAAVLALTNQSRLLERAETMSRSIKLRNPYVDPMSFLQVSLLRRWRAGGRARDALFHALLNSVNGIAHAMQDSG